MDIGVGGASQPSHEMVLTNRKKQGENEQRVTPDNQIPHSSQFTRPQDEAVRGNPLHKRTTSNLQEVERYLCTDPVSPPTYSRDSRHLTITSGKTAHIFTYKKVDATWLNNGTIEHHEKLTNKLCFSPDSRSLVAISYDNKAFIFDLHMDKWIRIFVEPTNLLSSCYSHNSRYLATYIIQQPDDIKEGWSSLCTLFSRDEQHKLLRNNPFSYPDFIHTVCFSPNDRFLMTVLKKSVIIRELEGSNPQCQTFNSDHEFFSGKFSPDSCTLVTVDSLMANIHVYSKERKLWEYNQQVNKSGPICRTYFNLNRDSQTMVTTSFGETSCILVCDKDGWKEQVRIPKTNYESSIGFSNSGHYLVLDTEDTRSSLIFTRNQAGEWIEKQRIQHSDAILHTRFISNDRQLVTNSIDKAATIYTLNDEALFVESDRVGHHGWKEPELYPDNRRLVISRDNSACILAVDETGRCKEQQKLPHESTVKYAKLSPDGNTLATVSKNNIFRIFMGGADSVQPESSS